MIYSHVDGQQLREIEGVAGNRAMAYHHEHPIAEIIERADLLRGWACLYPEWVARQES